MWMVYSLLAFLLPICLHMEDERGAVCTLEHTHAVIMNAYHIILIYIQISHLWKIYQKICRCSERAREQNLFHVSSGIMWCWLLRTAIELIFGRYVCWWTGFGVVHGWRWPTYEYSHVSALILRHTHKHSKTHSEWLCKWLDCERKLVKRWWELFSHRFYIIIIGSDIL